MLNDWSLSFSDLNFSYSEAVYPFGPEGAAFGFLGTGDFLGVGVFFGAGFLTTFAAFAAFAGFFFGATFLVTFLVTLVGVVVLAALAFGLWG